MGKGFNKGDVGKVLTISSQNRTRSNGFKLERYRFSKKLSRNWFTNRVVDDWNRLRLDGFMDGDERWM